MAIAATLLSEVTKPVGDEVPYQVSARERESSRAREMALYNIDDPKCSAGTILLVIPILQYCSALLALQ